MPYTPVPNVDAGDFGRASWADIVKDDLADHETRIVAVEGAGADMVGPGVSVEKEIALFDGTTGEVLERATGTGYVKVTSGVYQTPVATVPLATDVSGDLPFANLTQGSALSVLGVTGNATADHASIAAASDHQVLRRSGTAVAFGAVNLAQSAAVTGALPFANLPANMAQIYKATVTLTDAQIKALPTTPITLVAAPGSGLRIHVISAALRCDVLGGVYTNINGIYSAMAIYYLGQFNYWVAHGIVDDAFESPGIERLTQFISVAPHIAIATVGHYTDNFGNGWNLPPLTNETDSENKALAIAADNNGSGNFTGGNAANSLRVDVIYLVL